MRAPTRYTALNRSLLVCLVAAITLALGSPASCQDPDSSFVPSGDTVRLAFGWTAGLHGEVQLTRVRIDGSGPARADTSTLRTTYSLAVSKVEDGLRVEVGDFKVPAIPESDETAAAIALISSFSPSYVLSPGGDLLRLDGTEELVTRVRSMLDSMLTEGKLPAMKEAVDSLVSEEALSAQLSEEWTALVGAWLDAELEVGSLYELETEEALPLPGNPVVPFKFEFGVIDRVPCDKEDQTTSCVELVMRSFPDPDVMKQFMKQFLKDFTNSMRADRPEVPEMALRNLSVFSESVLVTSPETLIPRTLSITKRVNGLVTSGGVEQPISQTRKSYYVYSLTGGS
ncbi:MAG: hypothetical protein LJF06_11110 [Gemmatimonadetes bacterium]|nr:hypothetical protein [Gemmatimonadota bacterium]